MRLATTPSTPAKSPRRPSTGVVFTLLGAAAAVAAGAWWFKHQGIESTEDAYLRADAVTITSKVGGYVAGVNVQSNQRVRKGEVLMTIEGRSLDFELQRTQADSMVQQAALRRAIAEQEQARAQLEQVRAQQNALDLGLTYARSQLDRYAELERVGMVTRERLADLQHKADQANAQVASGKAETKATAMRVDAANAAVAEARAQLTSAQASVKLQQQQLNDLELTSPIDGVIGDATARDGQLVQPGMRLMTVVPTQALYVVANFKETQLRHLAVGQRVNLRVDALNHRPLSGTIESFAPGTGSQFSLLPAENATGNFVKVVQRVPVRIRLDLPKDADGLPLVPGLSVTVDVDTRANATDRTYG
jgi:membrane fusion protein (multidrug efflux system)